MSKQLLHLQIALFIVCCLAVLSCGGGTSTTTNAASVQFVTPSSSPTIDAGGSVAVGVSSNTPVSWSLQAAFGKPVGTLSNETASSATYTAPITVNAQTQVTIVATAGSNSASMGIFVVPALQVANTASDTSVAQTCPASGSVVLPASNGTILVGQYQTFGIFGSTSTASGVNGGVAPFAWSVASGALPAGLSLSLGTNTAQPFIMGTPITPGCSTFTLQVTDATGTTATSQTLNLIVIPPALKLNAPNIADALVSSANVGIPYPPVEYVATGGTPPYTWSVNALNPLPPGLSLSTGGMLSGVPSPLGLSANGGFGLYTANLLVSDSQYPYPATAAPSTTIQVINSGSSCGTGNESTLTSQGPYAFLLRGFDANGPVTISGNFTVNGKGGITAGVEDIARTTGAQTNLTVEAGSSYTLHGNRGCLTLVNSAGTTTTFRMVMGGCSTGRNSEGTGCQAPLGGGSFYWTTGHIVEFDDSTGTGSRLSGIVRLQDSSTFQNSGVSGMYAFGLSGWDSAGGRFAMAGSATAAGGSWTDVAADTNDAGKLGSTLTGGSGTFSIASSGRGTGTLKVGSLSLNVVLYPVGSKEAMIATIGPPSVSNPLLSGEAISTTGPFSFQALENTHMFHIAGLSTAGPDTSVGTLSFDGVGDVSGTEYENNAGTLSTTALSGSYSVDSTTARFHFFASQNQNVGIHPLVGYVIPAASTLTSTACNTPAACVTGFLLSTDSSAQAGLLEFQTSPTPPPPPFTISSLLGNFMYGTDEDLDAKTANIVGYTNADPASSGLTTTQDTNYGEPNYCLEPGCALLMPGVLLQGPYAVNSDGSGKFGGQTISVTNGAVTFFLDESPLDLHPSVMVAEE